ncbi:uncharacterized protein EI97DRAFT_121211 [Westerdykella ornata]|uniref:Uncharacterized protein n=1 Tax=Westerdykella ornata TaxID=318751 RepID=A0A6A6JUR1_WESOR|nr:uncharacterized protein EI97DRAFT_121211 [Westerdykella ornata]KAF2280360.1 hypothetical protein EI97DRAFT_121211 [Westerdykella ornata]
MATTNSNSCTCSLNNLQQMAKRLDRNSLPVDKILEIGTEFSAQLQKTIVCSKCVGSGLVASSLSHIMFRLIGFYEAAYLDAVDHLFSDMNSACSSNKSKSLSTTPSSSYGVVYSPTPPAIQRHSGCKSVAREMKLGEMPIDGLEGRLLVRVVLVDACLSLNEKIQKWKTVMEGSLDIDDQPYVRHCNAVIGRCLDRLANLLGLLRFDSFSTDRS